MNSSYDYDKLEKDGFPYELVDSLAFIGWDVLEPTFSCPGVVLNVLVFCIWMFGSKSRSLCCATYFTANAVADFLLLMIHPIILERGIIPIPWRKTDFTCKLFWSLYYSSLQVSTWISATITVERALTIIQPFVFRSQDMSRRSIYIIAMVIIMQPLTQIFNIMYMTSFSFHNITFCEYNSVEDKKIANVMHMCLTIAIPFLVLITFNLATITALCRNKFRQHTVPGNRDHILVFTKITLMTGVAFVMAYSLELYYCIYTIFPWDITPSYLNNATIYFGYAML